MAGRRYQKKGCKKEGNRLFSRVCCDRRREVVSEMDRLAYAFLG